MALVAWSGRCGRLRCVDYLRPARRRLTISEMRWVLLVTVIAGCFASTPAQRAETVCNAICDCAVGTNLPAEVQDCVEMQCLPQLPPVTDECLACVHQHESSCTSLQDACVQLCAGTTAPDLIGGSQ